MALTLPADGETFIGGNPGGLKVFRFSVGDTGESPDVVLGAQATYQILSVPIGFMVHDVHSRVITAFTASVTLNMGDGVTTDGYLTSTIIAPQSGVTTGVYKGMVDEGSTTYAGGHFYDVADTIDIVVGGADVAAGLAEIVILYSESSSDTA